MVDGQGFKNALGSNSSNAYEGDQFFQNPTAGCKTRIFVLLRHFDTYNDIKMLIAMHNLEGQTLPLINE